MLRERGPAGGCDLKSFNHNDRNEVAVPAREGEQMAKDRTQKINVSRRSIVKASLAGGPVIMTVTSRPAGAVSGGYGLSQ